MRSETENPMLYDEIEYGEDRLPYSFYPASEGYIRRCLAWEDDDDE
jgi:hypothetical protein